ncbi:MAG: membrane protein insertase YidC, partial [Candidatus Aminicenantes bacterium]|nr:membrane protein insertase YidC [Candidatus Aminicenantes bacterium]
MEKRLLLAIVLSFLVLFLYQALFVKKEPPQEPISLTAVEMEKKPEQEVIQKDTLTPSELPEDKDFQPISDQAEEQIIIDTSLFQAVWSNKGAILKSWKLKKHKDENKEDLELISIHSAEMNKYPFLLSTEDPSFDNIINNSLYKSSKYKLELKEGQRGEMRFDYADEKGTRVEKIFTFEGGKYEFDIQINVWKNGQRVEPRLAWGPGFGNPSPEAQKQRFGSGSGIAVYSAGKVFRHQERKYNPEKNFYNFVNWVAYEDNYFTVLFLTSPQKTSAAFLKEEKDQASFYFLSLNYPQKALIGPKDIDVLSEFGYDTKKLIKFGLFGFIAEILLKAIKSIHNVIPNWGLCIIILTFITKILFFPLTYSSTRSMS